VALPKYVKPSLLPVLGSVRGNRRSDKRAVPRDSNEIVWLPLLGPHGERFANR
jgi:hypothetical protein